MAAIAIGDCTVTLITPMAGMNFWSIVTPETADDGDTVDISTIVKTVYSCTVFGATDELLPATSVSAAGIVTIPGNTDNEARTIYVFGQKA
jgi:hypothetical protein